MEFTPYEIGLPKYGTFMKSEWFGSKFFMGHLVKKFPEPPLHFLQGNHNIKSFQNPHYISYKVTIISKVSRIPITFLTR